MAKLFKQPTCRTCGQPTEGIGSFWYCRTAECESFGAPTDDDGRPANIGQADGSSLMLVDGHAERISEDDAEAIERYWTARERRLS